MIDDWHEPFYGTRSLRFFHNFGETNVMSTRQIRKLRFQEVKGPIQGQAAEMD